MSECAQRFVSFFFFLGAVQSRRGRRRGGEEKRRGEKERQNWALGPGCCRAPRIHSFTKNRSQEQQCRKKTEEEREREREAANEDARGGFLTRERERRKPHHLISSTRKLACRVGVQMIFFHLNGTMAQVWSQYWHCTVSVELFRSR